MPAQVRGTVAERPVPQAAQPHRTQGAGSGAV